MKISLEIRHQNGEVALGSKRDETLVPLAASFNDDVYLAMTNYTFVEGDVIAIEADQPNAYLVVCLDATLKEDLVFLPTGKMSYVVSLTENASQARSELAFSGKKHYLSVRRAHRFEIENKQNLTQNTHDQKNFTGAYPHASANVETRDESVFFACNAIDGVLANHSHGAFPYQSWGINQQADAALTIEFGRLVEVNRVGICLRADFPHDSYWTQVTLAFSDGVEADFPLEKTAGVQYFSFPHQITTSVTLKNLQKAPDESPFPALTQLSVFGKNSAQ